MKKVAPIIALMLAVALAVGYEEQTNPGNVTAVGKIKMGKPFAAPCITDDGEVGAKMICQVHTDFTCKETACAAIGESSGNGTVEPPGADGSVDLEEHYEPKLVFCARSDGKRGTKYICSINVTESCFQTNCE